MSLTVSRLAAIALIAATSSAHAVPVTTIVNDTPDGTGPRGCRSPAREPARRAWRDLRVRFRALRGHRVVEARWSPLQRRVPHDPGPRLQRRRHHRLHRAHQPPRGGFYAGRHERDRRPAGPDRAVAGPGHQALRATSGRRHSGDQWPRPEAGWRRGRRRTSCVGFATGTPAGVQRQALAGRGRHREACRRLVADQRRVRSLDLPLLERR